MTAGTHVAPLALSLTLLCPSAPADVVACDPALPPGVICLAGNVTDTAGGGPLVSGQVYHLSTVTVPAGQSLTIEDGAILKFQPGAYLSVGGHLDAWNATFTSVRDDTVGGDTNGDSPEAPPARGDWDGIVFQATSDFSVFSGNLVRFAEVGTALQQANIFLTNSGFEECSVKAMSLSGNSFPILSNCRFDNNERALTDVPISAVQIFAQLTASGNARGDYIQISSGNVSAQFTPIGPANMLNGSAPLVLAAPITVNPGQTLALQPGLVIKVSPGLVGFDVQGTLDADGVVLTSLHDDSIAGDTAKDGLTFGTPGDWGRMSFQSSSDASVLRNTLVRFGGKAPGVPFAAPMLDLLSADITLDAVSVVECSDAALRLNNSSFPQVTGCSFADNLGKAVVRAPIAGIQGFAGCTAKNNALDAIEIESGVGLLLVAGFVPLAPVHSLNGDGVLVVQERVVVQPGGELFLAGGVVLKWARSNIDLDVEGTLTAGAPTVLTTLKDDEHGGDTNQDGGASAPQPGDWGGITFHPGSDASLLDGALIRYAGNDFLALAAVQVSGASPTIRDTTIELSETAALSLLSSAALPSVTGCTFRDSDLAVTRVPIAAVPGFVDNTATGNARGNYLEISTGNVPASPGPASAAQVASLVIGPANALLPSGVFVVSTSVNVPAGASLELQSGTVFKWDGNRDLDVDGSVTFGGPGAPVVFTSSADDAIGGDTKQDGFTEGTPGDWGQLLITASGSFLENVLVRFAGSGLQAAVRLTGADAQLHGVRVEDCAGTALAIPSSSPVVDGCAFDRNRRAVDQASIRALPGFFGNTASGNTLGDYIRVTDGNVTFDLHLEPEQSLNQGPLVFATSVSVLAGNELTLDPGLVLKFDGNRRVDVDGTLTTNAAPGSIVFTTLLDDFAGDTNNDGGATTPSPGQWTGIVFTGEGSVLAGARVRYAGSGNDPALRCSADELAVLDTLVEFSRNAGLQLSSGARPQVRRTSFTNGLGIPVNFVDVAALPGFAENTASGNAVGDYVRVTSASVGALEPLVIGPANSLNCDGVFVFAVSTSVQGGSTLELRQGTRIKHEGNHSLTVNAGAALVVEGTGLEPVVVTSIHDDAIGGDTRNDGQAALPAPGNWNQVLVNPGAAPSRIENLVLRYGGSGGYSFWNRSDQLEARALRADWSATDGLRASAHVGDAANWVAFQCGGDGIDLADGSFDLVHATVTGSAGPGLRKAATHFGALRNSISFGNPGGELAGFAPGDVFCSDVDGSFAGQDGNISADPTFVDPIAGDLGLGAGSPCIDAADLTLALATAKDHREASRILDHDLDGFAAADMGAFERAAWELVAAGTPRVGTTMTFTATGDLPGLAVFRLGLLDGSRYVEPFGFNLHGAGQGVLLAIAPTGQPATLDIPHGSTAPGTAFGVQALVRPVGGGSGGGAPLPAPDPAPTGGLRGLAPSSTQGGGPLPTGVGNTTNLYRGRVLP